MLRYITHQTCWVEFLFAGATSLLGQGIVGAMDNREADHTILYSLETLIHIVLPQSQALHYTAILNTQTHIINLAKGACILRFYPLCVCVEFLPDVWGRCSVAASSSSTAAQQHPRASHSLQWWSLEGNSVVAESPTRWRYRPQNR